MDKLLKSLFSEIKSEKSLFFTAENALVWRKKAVKNVEIVEKGKYYSLSKFIFNSEKS